MALKSPPQYEVGSTLGAHTISRKEKLDNIKGDYYELTHIPTGARHIHVACPDDNNAFGVLCLTVPQDDTGVAHILEHVALAGSERYPVRDPFFSMIPRSLKTFMNAMTSSDATFYPFSTRNRKDFFNLLNVYLDAVFFPRLGEESFMQEGHRFEFETLDDSSSPLKYKGVVFNEMKGQQSTPAYVVHKAVGKALFPDLTYSRASGGDPAKMPELTWQQLREFHARHYHPSNSYFFTYGDIPLEEVLTQIESRALSRFEKITPDVDIPDQKRFTEPKVFEETYPLAKEEEPKKKSQAILAWATTHVGDSFLVTCLTVLEDVLLGNPASPLRKALIDSGLGDTLADARGLMTSYREAVFAAGLKGIDTEDAEKVEKIVLDTLKKLADEGLDPEQVDASIHQLEIDQREISNAGFPYSLRVYFVLAGAYIYGGDPYRSLQFDEDVARIQTERKKGPFFETLIRRWLLDNPHRARLVIKPDQELEERRESIELAKLAEIDKTLSNDEKSRIVDQAKSLKESQESKQDLSSLPTLELSDIPMVFDEVPHTIEQASGAKLGLFALPTNGLTYVDIRASFAGMQDDLKDFLPLFSFAVTKMGAGSDDYVAMAKRIAAHTGGINAGTGLRQIAGVSEFNQNFTISGKALARNNEPLIAIFKDLLTEVTFDPKRLKEVLTQLKSQTESFVVQAGNFYAMRIAASKLSASSALEERLDGLTQLALLKKLSSEEKLDSLIDKLEAIRQYLFRSPGLAICITADEENIAEVRKLVEGALNSLPSEAAQKFTAVELSLVVQHEARTTAVPVAYNAKVFSTVKYTHADAPALVALGQFMRATYLHREIREKGGAYGAGVSSDPERGLFSFASYRDPNIVRTFQVFDSAVSEVVKGDIEADDLKEAIISTCGAIDPLESPDTKGRRRFFDDLAGYSLDLRAKFKQNLLNLTAADFRRVADTYLSTDAAALATISSPEMVQEANSQMGDIFKVSAI